ncbi:MAG: hypothetical protein K1060chlam1_01436 [Candidatus Anoxychlamydiales bacterium]|nr:hypothetical protein [Candidatus Anoxychlamydiales bacterium]
MPGPIPATSTSNPSTGAATPSPSSNPTPLGMSAVKDSQQSAGRKEEPLKTKKVRFIKTIISSIRKVLETIYGKIKDSIKKVFFCIFPFKNIFLKKQVISPTKQKYLDYYKRLYRVASLSSTLAQIEAEALLKEFNAFEKLGKIKQQKKSSSFIEIREAPTTEKIIKIGKGVAEKNHKKLIAVLKEYYTDQIAKLEIELKKE